MHREPEAQLMSQKRFDLFILLFVKITKELTNLQEA